LISFLKKGAMTVPIAIGIRYTPIELIS